MTRSSSSSPAKGRGETQYLLFDTETNGLPRRKNVPAESVENWPRIVQLAWGEYNGRGKRLAEASYIIRPDGFTIPRDAERIHGISMAMAKKQGRAIKYVLGQFAVAVGRSRTLVAHNLAFDTPIVRAEFIRAGLVDILAGREGICTMKIGTDVCRIPGRYGYKWPTLSELYLELFGASPGTTHRADADVDICARCFFKMKRLGLLA